MRTTSKSKTGEAKSGAVRPHGLWRWAVVACVIALAATAIAAGAGAIAGADPNTPDPALSPPYANALLLPHTYTRNLTFHTTITASPVNSTAASVPGPNDPGLSWSNSFSVAGTTSVGYVGVRANGEGFLSVWGATRCRPDTDSKSWCGAFNESGGLALTVRAPVVWSVNDGIDFTLSAQPDKWWSASAINKRTGVTRVLGSLQLPTGAAGLIPQSSWIEWYLFDSQHPCQGYHSSRAGATYAPVTGDAGESDYFSANAGACGHPGTAAVLPGLGAEIGVSPSNLSPAAQAPTSTIGNGAESFCVGMWSAHGANAITTPCGRDVAGVRFAPSTPGATTGTIRAIRTEGTAEPMCLDVVYESTKQDAPVVSGLCTGHSSQQWRLVSTARRTTELRNVNSGLCLDVRYNVPGQDILLTQGGCDPNSKFQDWKVTTR